MSSSPTYIWIGTSGGSWFDNHNWIPGFAAGVTADAN
jgi:hypothetical protein